MFRSGRRFRSAQGATCRAWAISPTATNPMTAVEVPVDGDVTGTGLLDADGHLLEDVGAIIGRLSSPYREKKEAEFSFMGQRNVFPPIGFLNATPFEQTAILDRRSAGDRSHAGVLALLSRCRWHRADRPISDLRPDDSPLTATLITQSPSARRTTTGSLTPTFGIRRGDSKRSR